MERSTVGPQQGRAERPHPPVMRVLRLCSVFAAPGVTDARFDPVGGMQHHTAQLTSALDRLGVAQEVVTAWRPDVPRLERLGERGVVHRLGLPVAVARQLYGLPAAAMVRRLAVDADLVHAHLGEDLAVLPLARLAAGRRLPLVVTVHCSLRVTVQGDGARIAVLRTLGGALERWAERDADAVIALAPRQARALLAVGVPAERLHVLPSGVDPALFRADGAPPPDPLPGIGHPRVVFVGRLAPQKGVAHLLHAVPHLRTPGARLVIVGDGPRRGELEGLAHRLGVADRVTFTGFAPHTDVPAHLAHADVLVLPSVYEELGSILVEALQAGVPTVASRVGGIPDVVADGVTGLLVPPADPAALAAGIDEVLGRPDLAARLRAGARARAASYHWPTLARRVLEVYRGAVAGRSAAPRDGRHS